MPDIQAPDFFTPKQSKKFNDLEELINVIKKFWGYLLVFIIFIFFISGSIIKVDAGERAVIFNIFGGIEKRVLGEGIHLVIPVIQKATIYDVKQATYSFTSEDQNQRGKVAGTEIHSLTSDGQRV